MLNLDQAGIAHCWETTQLLRAWEHAVQVEESSDGAVELICG